MKIKTSEIQELLLAVLPHWRYRIVKPFKKILGDGVSMEMYYCIQILRTNPDLMTMTELARKTGMPKQQVTKMVDRLIGQEFVERVQSPDDRRTIKLKITDKATEYINHFLESDAACFKEFFDNMESDDRNAFASALKTIFDIFIEMSKNDLVGKESDSQC